MNFSKPYPKDYRRPKDAEEILAYNLETVMRLLKEKGIREQEIAVGFLDETSPQLTANTVRVLWSFGKVKTQKNTDKIKSNTIGFYAIRREYIRVFGEVRFSQYRKVLRKDKTTEQNIQSHNNCVRQLPFS